MEKAYFWPSRTGAILLQDMEDEHLKRSYRYLINRRANFFGIMFKTKEEILKERPDLEEEFDFIELWEPRLREEIKRRKLRLPVVDRENVRTKRRVKTFELETQKRVDREEIQTGEGPTPWWKRKKKK